MSVKLTIAIPTHNRAALVRETLASVVALAIPAGVDADCIVIDNASTDDTAAIVDDFARGAALPMRRVFEARPGSSFARNRAVDETASDYIFFIDDDAVAERDWAAELLDDMRRRDLDAACGMVLPRWSSPPPNWLGPSLWVKLTQFTIAAQSNRRRLHRPSGSITISALMLDSSAQRLRASENFARTLGVVGGNPISGEDTELFARILSRGGAMGFAQRAIVHHLIPPERMTRAYLRRKSFAFGMGTAFAGLQNHNQFDKLVRNGVRMATAAMRGDPERAIYHELECANFLGYWRGRLIAR